MLFFLQKNLLVVVGWIAVIGAVISVLLGVRNAGRTVEKVEAIKQTLKDVNDANKIRTRVITDFRNGVIPDGVCKFYTDPGFLSDCKANSQSQSKSI